MYVPIHHPYGSSSSSESSLWKRLSPHMGPDDSPNGGLTRNTKIGIVVGVILFLTLLLAFYLVARYRAPPPPPPTHEQTQASQTLARWSEAVAGKGKTARIEMRQGSGNSTTDYELPPYSPPRDRRGHGRTGSSMSGATMVEEPESLTLPLPPPPPPEAVHFGGVRDGEVQRGRNETAMTGRATVEREEGRL